MMDFKNMNNNIISNRWKARYEKLPDDVKKKLDDLNNADIFDYQLQVIKRKPLMVDTPYVPNIRGSLPISLPYSSKNFPFPIL